MANNDKEINNVTGLKERASIKNTPDTVTILDDVNDILDASKKLMEIIDIGEIL